MHVNSGYASYGMYLAAAAQRMTYLDPGVNYTPCLFLDGSSQGSNYSNWENLITNRIHVPSPVTTTMWGVYDTLTRNGTIYAQFRNDSNATINANVLFVITEDSILHATPNGDLWHNHVARAYLPNYIGSSVSIPAGDSITVSYPFTIQSSWNFRTCEIVAIIQNPIAVGTTKEILQGGLIKVRNLNFTSIEEEQNNRPCASYQVNVYPNPCVNATRFAFTLPAGTEYKISIFDISGREIKTLNGIANGTRELINYNFSNEINSGVYFYRFKSAVLNSTGKLIVQ